MINIESAILNLNNVNQVIREQAIDICNKFQTFDLFNWEIWTNLSDFSKPQTVRIYAYATLSVVIQNEWSKIDTDSKFFTNFPYYNPKHFNNDPIKNAIVLANAKFLIYLSPFEMIIQLFDQANMENIQFLSSLLAEFVSCYYTQPMLPAERKTIVNQFMLNHLPKYVLSLILSPLTQLKFDSVDFSFYLSLLGKIHHDFILPKNLLCTSDVEKFYASFSPLLWVESDNIAIVWIFDSLFTQTEEPKSVRKAKASKEGENDDSFHATLEPIVASLMASAPAMFLQNYGELFFQVPQPSEKYPKILDSFISRIPIFFAMLERLNLDSILPFFDMLNTMLQSSSPTVIYETAENISELIKMLGKFPEFTDNTEFFKNRMNIFETCIKIISIQLELLPGAPYDDGWDIGNIRSSIFKLADTISEIDTEMVAKELIRFIISKDNEDSILVSLVRLLSFTLAMAISPAQAESQLKEQQLELEKQILQMQQQENGENNEKENSQKEVVNESNAENVSKKEETKSEEQTNPSEQIVENPIILLQQQQPITKKIISISNEAKMATSFLLSIIPNVSRGTSNYIFTALTKLIYFIDFTEEELNAFFPNLLNLFISMKPSSFDSFTSYFTSFFSHFSNYGISLPVDQLKAIPPDDPVYYTVATLISKFTDSEAMLDSAINDIDWFITYFNPQMQDSIDRLNRHILQSFDFIGQNPPKSEDSNSGFTILSKLVDSNNILVALVNNSQDESISNKFISPISHLSNAITTLADSFPSAMLSLIERLQMPVVIFECTNVWLKKIALPILTKLSSDQLFEDQTAMMSALFIVSEYSKLIASNLIPMIDMICANSEAPVTIENSAKKVAVILVKLTRFVQNENDAVQIMSIGLKMNDFRCFSNVVDLSAERGIHVFAHFWNDFIQRKETNYRDKLSEGLYYLYEKGKGDLNQFLQLPGVTQEQIASLEARLQNCGAARTKRKYIRLLIPP